MSIFCLQPVNAMPLVLLIVAVYVTLPLVIVLAIQMYLVGNVMNARRAFMTSLVVVSVSAMDVLMNVKTTPAFVLYAVTVLEETTVKGKTIL